MWEMLSDGPLSFVQVEAETDTGPSPQQDFAPIEDQVKKWELIAAREYQFDGTAEGWDSDVAEEETPEQKYIKVKLPSPAQACGPYKCNFPWKFP